MTVQFSREKISQICLIIPAILTTLAITQGDSTLAPSWIVGLVSAINWLSFVVLLFLLPNKKLRHPAVLLATVIWFLLSNFHQAQNNNADLSGFLMFFLLSLFAFIEDKYLIKTIKYFRYYMIGMAMFGIIIYVDFILGLGLPHEFVAYYGSNENASYANYFLSYLFVEFDGVRLCGLFNEPGYLGTFSGLFIVLDHFNYKRKGNWALFVAGCLSFSMAFFVILIIGGCLTAIESWRKLIVGACFIALFGGVISSIHTDNTAMNYLMQRFQYDSKKGTFAGNNRKDYSFIVVEREFDSGNKQLFGYGTGYCKKKNVVKTATYKSAIVEWGYLGFLLTYGLLVLSAFKMAQKNKAALILCVCFSLSLYQRPYIFSLAYYLILFGGILYLKSETNR